MNISLDGYVARPNGEIDLMNWERDEEITNFIHSLIDSSDTILLGRKMTDDFVNHWEHVVYNEPGNPDFPLAKKMVDTPKIVFTKTLDQSRWNHTTLANGNLAEEIAALKKQSGKDIIVYGGAALVSSLIQEDLIDAYHFFINPVAIGSGMAIFSGLKKPLAFSVTQSKFYSCGITVISCEPKRV
jgi:dihydrofolate reductase